VWVRIPAVFCKSRQSSAVADSLRPLEPHVGPRVRVLVPEARAVCRGPDNLALSGAVWRCLALSGATRHFVKKLRGLPRPSATPAQGIARLSGCVRDWEVDHCSVVSCFSVQKKLFFTFVPTRLHSGAAARFYDGKRHLCDDVGLTSDVSVSRCCLLLKQRL